MTEKREDEVIDHPKNVSIRFVISFMYCLCCISQVYVDTDEDNVDEREETMSNFSMIIDANSSFDSDGVANEEENSELSTEQQVGQLQYSNRFHT